MKTVFVKQTLSISRAIELPDDMPEHLVSEFAVGKFNMTPINADGTAVELRTMADVEELASESTTPAVVDV